MFNSPLLDIAIGLVFIFLLYSLLVTSINEAIATFFSLRAKMLKSGIVVSMLSDTSTDSRWKSLAKGISGFFVGLLHWEKKASKNARKIGDLFFDHPLIKNYGSSRLFPIPSYIPTNNFSTVLMDVLKQDFDSKVPDIAQYRLKLSSVTDSIEVITQNLANASDTTKIKELLEYYGHHYTVFNAPPPFSVIDKDTWQILQMHLKNSIYDITQFEHKIENWYDDSMNRVSGWYKRQTQMFLFILGFIVAVVFNVDTIEIAGRLSTDKDARSKLVQIATEAVDKYKDDPRVKKTVTGNGIIVLDTTHQGKAYNDSLFREYQAKLDTVKNMLKGDVDKTNEIIASGWGDYGQKSDGDKVLLKYVKQDIYHSLKPKATKTDSIKCKQAVLDSLYQKHWVKLKVCYIVKESAHGKKILGYLILAFAVSLGSPFWFDLLNKLVKLRGAGKKEDDGAGATTSKSNNIQTPTTVIVNPPSAGEEAAG